MMDRNNFSPRAFLARLRKHFCRQPVFTRGDVDSDATEFVSGSEFVRGLVYEIKTEQGWIICHRD